MYECKILADSVYSHGSREYRLTSFCVTFPRFILAEVNTHRMLSRNSASSRAIPVAKSIQAVKDDPFIPEAFGQNQPGMSWATDLDDQATNDARDYWGFALDESLWNAESLANLGVHKALANRILEPYKWHTAILTGTDWSNFFALRTDVNAQPEFRKIALMMQEQYRASIPEPLHAGEWHLPLVDPEEMFDEALQYADPVTDWRLWTRVAIGRCARVSYLTHEGKRDPQADCDLHDHLKANGHLSPFEHIARPFTVDEWHLIKAGQKSLGVLDFEQTSWKLVDGIIPPSNQSLVTHLTKQLEYCGNFRGWHQARYDIPNQEDFSLAVHH